MKTLYCVVLLSAGLLVMAAPAWAQDKVDAVSIVRKHIDSLPNGKGAGEVIGQTSDAVKLAFPDHQLVIVRFRVFPVRASCRKGCVRRTFSPSPRKGRLSM